jgi:hypothetical protein
VDFVLVAGGSKLNSVLMLRHISSSPLRALTLRSGAGMLKPRTIHGMQDLHRGFILA